MKTQISKTIKKVSDKNQINKKINSNIEIQNREIDDCNFVSKSKKIALPPLFDKMIKKVFLLVILSFITGTYLSSYGQEPDKKSEKARKNLVEAQKDVDKARNDSIEDYNKFKKESEDKITAHRKSIADFKARIVKEKIENRENYEKKLTELDNKNTDLKKKLDEYKETGKDKWSAFKNKFKHDMDEIGKELKNFKISN
ncbi:MAG: hypothetical protein A2275_09815 [Bacteroidetes bacterium RIFOXYA12_FULL_35_11]|nr:MAG: hypothetical protein A2X01_02105 [Bacteroidetes bacterium GWF2_35_48]OFY82349.1 MAG: hypothetical protein A2275_09815 [Bacteroidetes bacterium RIFOXYA12_FULL_35_11]OFY98729.1 MAG: hypothetical protein A2491_01895 [Bacteroidetes bacterium RIFOXYC12_FULL_35_7]HBX49605.1 hypothetical protein [Bacteroidales bacterium]